MQAPLRIRKYISLGIASLFLGGCTSPLTPDFGQMSAKYANSLEQYQINMIFQNILRASENRPVSFLDMPTINGSGSIGVTPSVSALFTGGAIPYNASYQVIQGGLSYATPSTSLTLNNTFNFTQSSLDNAVFWKNYLSELPKETVKYFSHNHIPKEVLLSLVVDEIEIFEANGKTTVLVNNPLRPEHPQFQQSLYRLINNGFTAELIDTSEKLGPPITMEKVTPRFGETAFTMFKDSNITLKSVGSPKNPLYQPIQVSSMYKLCINSDQFANYLPTKKYGQTFYCENNNQEDLAKTSAAKKAQPTLIVRIRSTNNVFEYLGKVVRAQLAEKPYLITLPPTADTFNSNRGKLNQYALLVVDKDKPKPKPFAVIEGLDGDTYSIPSENNGYSPLTIKLLAQLMSLQKVPGSIPASPSVLLK
ncbi:hypothetical protein ICN17_05730 [Polynucleobacter sp. 73C-SIWE]|uniref:hypothetical protein n=1 Tax=Polynucleobacter sp. 73C-SIWE TaxID=2689098 RepID=UPI001C0BCEDD|nr:hypothetical protein [Polynucleobacter sp. 73C-SIWE]MBU3579503.1 hypothetical protein [Polynucleobacter sp. 73C-SIWE]